MVETWTLIEHEQSGLVMVPLHQAERELSALRVRLAEAQAAGEGWFRSWETADKDRGALRAQLTEKDREIEWLKAREDELIESLHDQDVRPVGVVISELETRFPGMMAIHRCDHEGLQDQLSASQAREREAVEARQNAEAARQQGWNEAREAKAALAAARKALEDLASAVLRKNADGKPMHSRQGLNNIARAALNGDSHADARDAAYPMCDVHTFVRTNVCGCASRLPEPPKEDSHA